MSISGLISSRSSMDENTPENNQDLITIKDRYNPRCIHEVGCNDAPAVEELEEVTEEQSLTEDSTLGNFGKPIYPGVGFHRASNFHDSECGEPVRTQHLRLDFSPIEGVDDNEFIVNKCRDFWTFIETVPGITGLRAVSEYHDNDELKTITKTETARATSSSAEPTATDWLKCKEGLMSKAFATKQPERCEGGSGDNCSDWHPQKYGKRDRASLSAPRINASRRKHSDSSKSSKPSSSEEAILLCEQIEAWDLSHPKSMEPPGHPPILSHALIQRQNLC